jgi:phosphopantothenoylcysteine decarboxylase/phosphopantothenate--cysteine ligase
MRPKLVIGFAAETNDLEINAISKLKSKNCDWIIANDISKKNSGFNSDFNEVTIYFKNSVNKKEKLTLKKKSEISEEIVDRIVAQIN